MIRRAIAVLALSVMLAAPSLAAGAQPGSTWPCVQRKVAELSLASIWQHSPGLEAFRGEAWMPEPCRSCERRSLDFGGCRCQAYHLTGNAAFTDPACALSPHHELIVLARRSGQTPGAPVPLRYRRKGSATRT